MNRGASEGGDRSESRAGEPRSRRATLSRRTRVAIFVVALLVRVVVGYATRSTGEMEGLAHGYKESAYAMAAGYGFVRPAKDGPREVELIRLADSLAAHGQRLSPANAPPITPARWKPLSLHPPGYSAFLFALYRTIGPPATMWARLLQAIADAGACVLVAMIGAQFVTPLAGAFAGFATALFPPIAYLATSRIADSAAAPLFVLFDFLFLWALDRRKPGYWAGAGLVAGLLFQLRPDYALAPVLFIAAALLFVSRRRATLGGAALMFAVMSLLVLPWALRNQKVMGHFTPATTSAGMSMLMSVGQFENPYGIGPQDAWFANEAIRVGFEDFDDPAADRYFRSRYLDIARRDPALILAGMARRTLLAIATPYHFGYQNPAYEGHSFYDYLTHEGIGPSASLRRHPAEVLRAYWDRFAFVPVSILLFAAAAGFVFRAGRRWGVAILLLLPWLHVWLSHLPFFLTTRMLVPGIFAQLIAAGALFAWWRDRRVTLRGPGDPGDSAARD